MPRVPENRTVQHLYSPEPAGEPAASADRPEDAIVSQAGRSRLSRGGDDHGTARRSGLKGRIKRSTLGRAMAKIARFLRLHKFIQLFASHKAPRTESPRAAQAASAHEGKFHREQQASETEIKRKVGFHDEKPPQAVKDYGRRRSVKRSPYRLATVSKRQHGRKLRSATDVQHTEFYERNDNQRDPQIRRLCQMMMRHVDRHLEGLPPVTKQRITDRLEQKIYQRATELSKLERDVAVDQLAEELDAVLGEAACFEDAVWFEHSLAFTSKLVKPYLAGVKPTERNSQLIQQVREAERRVLQMDGLRDYLDRAAPGMCAWAEETKQEVAQLDRELSSIGRECRNIKQRAGNRPNEAERGSLRELQERFDERLARLRALEQERKGKMRTYIKQIEAAPLDEYQWEGILVDGPDRQAIQAGVKEAFQDPDFREQVFAQLERWAGNESSE